MEGYGNTLWNLVVQCCTTLQSKSFADTLHCDVAYLNFFNVSWNNFLLFFQKNF